MKKIKVLHIFKMSRFHINIDSVIYETVKEENKNEKLESYIYIPKVDFQMQYEIDGNISLVKVLNEYSVDLVIFHSLYKLEYLKLYRILNKKNIPYLIRPHGSFSKIMMKKNNIKKIICNVLFFNKFIEKSNGILYLNQMEFKKSYFNTKQNYYLPNMINIKLEEKIDGNREKIKIIFIAKIDFYYKNIAFMVEVMKKILNLRKDIEFLIYGPANKDELKRLNLCIGKFNYGIKYCGAVYKKEKEKVYKEADIFLLLSISEGMPMVLLEALSYSLPCLVSFGTNMGEEINEYNCGIGVHINRIDTVVREFNIFIEKYKNDPELYKKNAIKLVKEKYKWNTDENFNIYSEILKGEK